MRGWRRTVAFALIVSVLALGAAACGSSGNARPTATAAGDATYDFPVGPAVLVPVDYEAPTDRVDSTGAFLPANGIPTLVFVDAIW
jgi:hypothetical protein